ncbi:MAG: hypothetical protein A3E18_02180 [Candidatus Nealsonbacteria bacterium RIFCSPHIGHO2_12_FULL_38_18]|nr:MAG: hypothetical protein A3E18_02180 [Candidatus Nealsonbacteria bacterium RIFCSPHIGHO2_12_FULL_38_18]
MVSRVLGSEPLTQLGVLFFFNMIKLKSDSRLISLWPMVDGMKEKMNKLVIVTASGGRILYFRKSAESQWLWLLRESHLIC